MLRTPAERLSPGYQIFMLVLCLYSLGILAYQASGAAAPSTAAVLDYADFAVCMLFLGDFVFSLVRAENRWRYFITWGWLDLLSSIPAVDVARWGRAARILRIFRLLRAVRASQLLADFIVKKRAQNGLLAVSLLAIILITFCSVSILQVESRANGNIVNANDAVWWAFTTITTVGYGDRYPTTGEGRMIAVVLMIGGVGLFGTFSGLLASWFVGKDDDAAKEIAALREQIAQLTLRLGPAAAQPSAGDVALDDPA
jgi:voltage-gated potassium channel